MEFKRKFGNRKTKKNAKGLFLILLLLLALVLWFKAESIMNYFF
ncbi:hypothetical protein OD91_1148 [Lutibacter sp. Hel_I_33_5]|nr:hypothetical protein OD91_1148 [Lutibacter sp. Hel_I_33_5]